MPGAPRLLGCVMPDAEYLKRWRRLSLRVEQRLEAGESEYGGRSYGRPPGDLVSEIEEELLDIIGWAAILHERIQGLRQMVRQGEEGASTGASTSSAPSGGSGVPRES